MNKYKENERDKMNKEKIIGKLINAGKRYKFLKPFALGLIFVVSFVFNLNKEIGLKKYKFLAVAVALLILIVYNNCLLGYENKIKAAENEDDYLYSGVIVNNTVNSNEVLFSDNVEEPKEFMTKEAEELLPFSTSDWNLILVNKDHKIDEDYTINKKSFGGFTVDERIYDALSEMFSDAKAEGMSLVMASGYRTTADQTYLFNRKVNQYRSIGMSLEDSQINAAMIVTPPDTSEHQTGLAVDILSATYSSMDWDYGKTAEGIWLAEHCYDYGFILRYPLDSEEITQIIYEPWHFRYVGVEAASYIKEHNITLEEFYELLLKAEHQ